MYELTIELNTNNKIPLYEQIYNFIKNEIKNGNIPCKAKLPSTRSLATHLAVSRSTVDLAYAQLVSEGYIEAEPYRGYYVSEITLLYDQGSSEKEAAKEKTVPKEKDGIDFSPWGIDLSSFPYNAWRKISRALLSIDNKELFAPCHYKGEYGLRLEISRYLYEARGVKCVPEHIILGAGNEYLLAMINQLFCTRPMIAMESPTYTQAFHVFRQNGNTIIPIKVDKNGMVVKELMESDAKIAYVMPSHQFPTGVVMPIKRRLQLLEWAMNGTDRYIIEDDYDSEFRYLGKPIPALQSIDRNEKVIYMGTFSKAIAPSIRMSYMVLPQILVEQFEKRTSFYSQTVSKMDQMIVSRFMKEGYFERHLNKMRAVYRNKHDLILSLLKECNGKISISGENSGLHIILTVNNQMSEEKLIAKAKEEGIIIHGISQYYIDKKNVAKSTVLIGFAGLSQEEIKTGIAKIRKAWNI
ncbi:MAG: PLP-dependent aminotransferase family protein [Lachnospiraceae bacterium]|nr:PLP-dependent aminotransferase family protein [Lachnospiraceae bacterium]